MRFRAELFVGTGFGPSAAGRSEEGGEDQEWGGELGYATRERPGVCGALAARQGMR
jgi:hypothetical protein